MQSLYMRGLKHQISYVAVITYIYMNCEISEENYNDKRSDVVAYTYIRIVSHRYALLL